MIPGIDFWTWGDGAGGGGGGYTGHLMLFRIGRVVVPLLWGAR